MERGAAGLPWGDSTRMGRVLLGLEPRLTAVARRLVRNPDAAADIVQNAFEKVLLLTASALEERAYAALALELGLSPGAVKSRAFRAPRRLAAELETT